MSSCRNRFGYRSTRINGDREYVWGVGVPSRDLHVEVNSLVPIMTTESKVFISFKGVLRSVLTEQRTW